jgi:alkanesulfonate monooxygenase SsuD/methylene tetrahydromethanopterin reductase-like flavin-dependent oxidoreductase (luciferase family)
MRHGFVLAGGTALEQVELAVLADRSGWDAVFVWEGGYAVDAWTLLAGMAMRTTNVRLGTILTPLPWRRPWKLAAQVATLDQLSNGRAMLAVGLGAVDTGLGTYGEVTDRKARAALLDDGIDMVRGLWSGETKIGPIDISGAITPTLTPVQERIPIWAVGAWPSERSMTRVLRCDGLLPALVGGMPSPADLRAAVAWLTERGWSGDVVQEGETTIDTVHEITAPWAEAGATWWLETRWTAPDLSAARERIEAGPVPSSR